MAGRYTTLNLFVPLVELLGGRLHVGQDRLERLRHFPSAGFHFRFWGDQDMFELETVKGLRPCYTIVTCHAPAGSVLAAAARRAGFIPAPRGITLVANPLRLNLSPDPTVFTSWSCSLGDLEVF